jgi:septal ring factor EnvC (AmiA/AmiB activator)
MSLTEEEHVTKVAEAEVERRRLMDEIDSDNSWIDDYSLKLAKFDEDIKNHESRMTSIREQIKELNTKLFFEENSFHIARTNKRKIEDAIFYYQYRVEMNSQSLKP